MEYIRSWNNDSFFDHLDFGFIFVGSQQRTSLDFSGGFRIEHSKVVSIVRSFNSIDSDDPVFTSKCFFEVFQLDFDILE